MVFSSRRIDLTALVGDFLTHDPQPRTVPEHKRQPSLLTFDEGDLLLDEVPEKDSALVSTFPSLVGVHLPASVLMVERPLDRNPSTIGEPQLRGPWIETYLANFKSHQKL